MSKNQFTPREELICGKLDLLFDLIVNGDRIKAIDILSDIRHDAERMEQKLISRKQEVNDLNKLIQKQTK